MHCGRLGGGLHGQFVDEPTSQCRVHLQRLRGPAFLVQRSHQQGVRPFP